MRRNGMRAMAMVAALAGVWDSSSVVAQGAPAKYALSVPGGLAFAEFKGYEGWQLVSISEDGGLMAAILGNPMMIRAYEAGIPGNGQPFPAIPSCSRPTSSSPNTGIGDAA
jgi:hypothetical protein